ncbi:hypothetical protein PR048_030001 [Dryococelus australis]|uniref:Uncharacterized protein n=1 Tax=Dryococelus australis TaxID=614101 RepID=A0ABQ9G868_9NEOP|nr:hypothetical protein PR048_030001 [Dryococelus australis]
MWSNIAFLKLAYEVPLSGGTAIRVPARALLTTRTATSTAVTSGRVLKLPAEGARNPGSSVMASAPSSLFGPKSTMVEDGGQLSSSYKTIPLVGLPGAIQGGESAGPEAVSPGERRRELLLVATPPSSKESSCGSLQCLTSSGEGEGEGCGVMAHGSLIRGEVVRDPMLFHFIPHACTVDSPQNPAVEWFATLGMFQHVDARSHLQLSHPGCRRTRPSATGAGAGYGVRVSVAPSEQKGLRSSRTDAKRRDGFTPPRSCEDGKLFPCTKSHPPTPPPPAKGPRVALKAASVYRPAPPGGGVYTKPLNVTSRARPAPLLCQHSGSKWTSGLSPYSARVIHWHKWLLGGGLPESPHHLLSLDPAEGVSLYFPSDSFQRLMFWVGRLRGNRTPPDDTWVAAAGALGTYRRGGPRTGPSYASPTNCVQNSAVWGRDRNCTARACRERAKYVAPVACSEFFFLQEHITNYRKTPVFPNTTIYFVRKNAELEDANRTTAYPSGGTRSRVVACKSSSSLPFAELDTRYQHCVCTVPETIPLVGRRGFSGNYHFSRPCIPALLHTRLASPSSALKTLTLRAAQNYPPSTNDASRTSLDAVVRCVQGLEISIPTKANRAQSSAGSLPEFSQVGIVPDTATGPRVFPWDIPFPSIVHSSTALSPPCFALIGSQDPCKSLHFTLYTTRSSSNMRNTSGRFAARAMTFIPRGNGPRRSYKPRRLAGHALVPILRQAVRAAGDMPCVSLATAPSGMFTIGYATGWRADHQALISERHSEMLLVSDVMFLARAAGYKQLFRLIFASRCYRLFTVNYEVVSSGTHARNIVVGADALGEQAVPYLPREYRRALPLVFGDLIDYVGGRDPRLGAAYCPGLYRPCFVVPAHDVYVHLKAFVYESILLPKIQFSLDVLVEKRVNVGTRRLVVRSQRDRSTSLVHGLNGLDIFLFEQKFNTLVKHLETWKFRVFIRQQARLLSPLCIRASKLKTLVVRGECGVYLPRILETQPLETWRMREMSQGRAPEWASSTIFWRVLSGRGRPFTYTPPSWLIPLWPAAEHPNIVLAATCWGGGWWWWWWWWCARCSSSAPPRAGTQKHKNTQPRSRGAPEHYTPPFRRAIHSHPQGAAFINTTAYLADYDGNTARLARRSDKALGMRVSVARNAPSLLDLGRAAI